MVELGLMCLGGPSDVSVADSRNRTALRGDFSSPLSLAARQYLQGKLNPRCQSTAAPVHKGDVAPVAAGDGAHYGQAKSNSSGLAASRRFAAIEGLEDLLGVLLRDAAPIVLDLDDGVGFLAENPRARPPAELHSVFQQVRKQPPERHWVAFQDHLLAGL